MSKFNAFEGGRRIIHLAASAGVLVAAWNIWDFTPRYRVEYAADSPNRALVRQADNADCSYVLDGYGSKTITSPEGVQIFVHFCFPAQDFSGQMLVPYKTAEDQKVWGHTNDSPLVKKYVQERVNAFSLTHKEMGEIITPWKKRYENAKEVIKFLAVYLIGLYVFSFALGWILRGFLGIPDGADKRPVANQE